jgi:hypothetical protein
MTTLKDLASGLSDLSDDQLLQLISEIRRDRTTPKVRTATKKAVKKQGDADFNKLLGLLGELPADQLEALLGLEDSNGTTESQD